jgi:hypothetical protein
LDLAVIPHWNNAEGGTYDTRYCWMGAPRLALLEKALPDSTVILGVDEWTACVVDPAAQECLVVGAGQVTIRHDNHEHVFPAGTQFGLDQLHASALSDARESAKPIVLPQEAESVSATRFLRQLVEYDARALTSQEVAGLIGRVCELATALERAQASGVPGELIDAGRGKMRALLDIVGARLGTTGARGDLAPLMDLLIHTRMKLRAAKQYALADEIRDELARLNVVLEDTPQGTTWRKK